MTYIDEMDQEMVEANLVKMRARNDTCMAYAHGDERFALWLALANQKAGRKLGVGIFDLSDFAWRDAYTNGDSPIDALREAVESDDMGSMLGDLDEIFGVRAE